MKHKLSILMLLAALIVPWAAKAQTVTLESYGFTTGVDATKWVDMTSATSLSFAASGDYAVSTVQNIGFSFPFASETYTQFSVNSDGNLRLGSTVTGTSNYSTPFSSSNASVNNPKINFFGCDGYLDATYGHYVKMLNTVDASGDTLLVVEFSTGTYTSTTREYMYKWQVHLYANGNIDIVFPDSSGIPTTAPAVTHQSGLCASSSDGWVVSSVTNSAVHFTAGSTSTNPSGTWFDANRYYTFIHPSNISCPAPTGITVSNVTPDGATLSWNPGGTEAQWEVQVGNDFYYSTDTTYTLTSLTANTPYVVSVRAICGTGDTSFASSSEFRTACLDISTLPYSNDFENEPYYSAVTYAEALPFCWHRINDATVTSNYYPYVTNTSNYVHSGSKGLYWYHSTSSGYAQNEYAILPPVDLTVYDISDLTLAFYAKTTSASYHPMPIVGVMTDPTDATTFTPVRTFTNTEITTSWQLFDVSFDNYTGSGNYIAIKWPNPGSTCYLAIDDIYLTDDWCNVPTNVMATSTTNSITVSWGTSASSATVFLGTDTIENVTGTSYTFTGLTANTPYSYGVASECTSAISQFVNGSIRTLCDLLDSLPYTYGFDDLATGSSSVRPEIPCWHHLNNATTYFGYPYVSSTNHTGGRSLYWYGTTTTGTYGDYEMVVLPGVDPTLYPVNTLQLSFWARPSSTSYYPVFVVGVMTDPTDASTFQAVETVNVSNSTAWQFFTVSLGTYTGTGNYVAVRMNRPGSSYYAYTDDFTLEPLPNCPAITDITVEGATVGSALVTWDIQSGYDAPASYEVVYDSVGGTNPTTLTVTDPFVAISGLEMRTTYKVRVRANCGADGYGAADSTEFTTGPVSTIALDGGTTTTYYLPIGNFYNYSYTQQLVMASEMNGPAVLTGIDFEYGYSSPTTSKTNVTIYLANTSATSLSSSFVTYDTSFHAVYTGNLNATNGWNHYAFDTAFNYDGTSNLLIVVHDNSGSYNGSSYVFKAHSATGKGRYIQNDSSPYTLSSPGAGTSVSYRANMHIGFVDNGTGVNCANPVAAVVSADTASITLAWAPGYTETSWDVDYRIEGATTWTNAATAVTSTSYTITGLTPGTDYEFRVSHECENTTYAATVTHSTPCVPMPIPYSENFDAIVLSPTAADNYGLLPNCWSYVMTGSSSYTSGSYLPKVYNSSYATSGSQCLYLYGVGLFSLPEMSVSLDSLQLTFNDYPSTSAYYGLIVGVMEGSIFVPVDTIDLTPSVSNAIEVVFANYHGTSRTIAFKNYYTSSTSTYYSYHYIDDIVVDYLPSCPHVTNVHTTLNTGDSVMLAWNPGSEEVEWVVTLGDTSFVVLEDSVLLTDLSSSRHYYGTITAVCSSDDSSVAYPFHFRTACGKLTSLPYVQDFENENTTSSSSSNFIPCWHHLNNGTSYPGYPYLSATSSYNHTTGGIKGLYWSASTTTGTYGDYYAIVLPEVDTTILPVRTLKLSFWAKSSSTSYQPVFYVGVMSNPDSINSFVYVDTINVGNNTNWTRYTTVLSNYSDTGTYIAIRGNRPSSTWYAYMDDIELDLVPACPPVEDVTVEAGTTSAIVHWNTINDAVLGAMVEYKPDTATTWSSVTVTGTNYAVLTGLAGGTTYNVRVYGTCADGNATAATSYFTTTSFACEVYDTTTMVVFSDTIGNGTATNTYFPSYSLYNYGLTQQIFTPTELGHGGTINNIAFHMNAVSQQRTFEIYMGHTANATATEFLNPSDLTLVYNGGAVPLVANQWINFNLTTPFNYNGTDNLVVFFRDMTGSYVSGNSSYGTEGASGVSRYIYQDGGAYTVGSTTGGTTSTFRCNLVLGGISAQCIQQSTCAAPVAYVTGVTSTTASVVWAPGNTDTAWNLYYRLAGAPTFTTAATGVTATNYTFTGLLSGMPYEFKVENVCSGESLFTVVEATTECAAITVLPFVEDFNNWGTGTGILPNCWYRTGSYSTYSYIIASQNMSGSTGGSVYMYQSSSTPYTAYASTLILPALDTSLFQANQTQLVFGTMYASTSYGRPKFEIGVVSDPMDFSTFVPVDTVQHSGGINRWEMFEVPLAAYTGNGAYVAMRTVYDSAYTYPYVDNVTLELIPTCPRPDTLTASNATTNSVDLGWHERGAATTWIIEYGPVGFALGTGTQVVATSNPFTLTGLPAAYQGEFYVKSICGAGDTGDFSRMPYAFNTSQVPSSIPYSYGFEDPAEWALWQTSSNSATTNWYRGTAVADSGSYSLYVSADSGLTYTPYTHSAIVNAAAYRDIDFGTIDSSFTLSFSARAGGTISNYYDGLMVFLVDPSLSTVPSNAGITTPWGNVNDLYRIATVRLDTTWQTYEASFDTIHGVHRVAFFWFNQNTQASYPNLGEPAAVDNLYINYSSCPRPLNLDTLATTGSTATLTWTGEASANYEVLYRQIGGTNHTAYTNTNSITLTGLASAAEHVAWVRKLCGAGDTSLWSDNTTFYTKLCDGAVEMTNAPSTGTAYYTPLNNFYNYTLTETIIDSAELVGLSNITTIAYEYAYATASTDKTDVTIWLQPTNKTTFSSSSDIVALDTTIAVQVYSGALNCSQGWNYFAFSTPFVWDGHSNLLVIVDDNSGDYNGSAYVFNTTSTGSDYKTIHYYSDSYNPDPLSPSSFSGSKGYLQYRATMRLISCGVGCTAPSASVTAVDYQSATIMAAGTGSSYELNYGTDPAVLGTTVINTTGVFNLTGLNPNTQYFFEVRQLCDSSTWSSVADGTFTTNELPCFTPDSVEVVATSFSTATLHWISAGSATQWAIEVNGAGVQRFDTVGTNPYTIPNLYADQDYTASVRAICLTGVVESDWSDTIAFHTDACLPVSGVTVNNVTASSATASWQPTNGALGYRVSYGEYDFIEAQALRVEVDANTTSYTFTGLEAETRYEFYVQTKCGEGLFSSITQGDRIDFMTEASQGIYDVESGTLTLFPNPASTSVTLTVSGIDGEVTVEIVDLNGKRISELRTQNSELTIDVTSMAQGAYFVRVTGDRQTAVRKLIVR